MAAIPEATAVAEATRTENKNRKGRSIRSGLCFCAKSASVVQPSFESTIASACCPRTKFTSVIPSNPRN